MQIFLQQFLRFRKAFVNQFHWLLGAGFFSLWIEKGFSLSENFDILCDLLQEATFYTSFLLSFLFLFKAPGRFFRYTKFLFYTISFSIFLQKYAQFPQSYFEMLLTFEFVLWIGMHPWWTKAQRNPGKLMLYIFLMLIFVGMIGLMLPKFHTSSVPFIDALFTATSALCVTGLSTIDVSTQLSHAGQVFLSFLFQIGGVGPFAILAFIAYLSRTAKSSGHSNTLTGVFTLNCAKDTRNLVFTIFGVSFLTELAGMGLLYLSDGGQHTLFWYFFHSASAFCNAGFSLTADSLAGFKNNPGFLLTISFLIFVGGLGFPVWLNLFQWFRSYLPLSRKKRTLSRYSIVTLKLSSFFVVFGTLYFYTENIDELSQSTNLLEGISASIFHSLTLRTAGFSTFDLNLLSGSAFFVSLIFMIIGAGALSTGGGIKISTFYLVWRSTFLNLKGESTILINHREVLASTIQLVISVVFLYFLTLALCLFGLLFTDPTLGMKALLFETISALSTVGLSLGITSQFSAGGKLILIIAMIAGRVGPLVIASAFMKKKKSGHRYQYPSEPFLIG